MSAVMEIKQLIRKIAEASSIDGFLTMNEGILLYLLAKYEQKAGRVVEIGSFKGRSTYWLAVAARECNDNKVIAVDHHLGNKEHHDANSKYSVGFPKEGTYKQFVSNMQRFELDNWVASLKMNSSDAARLVNEPIRLLFIDGSHSYLDVRADFEMWEMKVCDNGLILIHDSTEIGFDGPRRLVREIDPNKYELLFQLDSISMFMKKNR